MSELDSYSDDFAQDETGASSCDENFVEEKLLVTSKQRTPSPNLKTPLESRNNEKHENSSRVYHDPHQSEREDRLYSSRNSAIITLNLQNKIKELQSEQLRMKSEIHLQTRTIENLQSKNSKTHKDKQKLQQDLIDSNQNAFEKLRESDRLHELEANRLNDLLREQQHDFIRQYEDIKAKAKREARILQDELYRKKLKLEAEQKDLDLLKEKYRIFKEYNEFSDEPMSHFQDFRISLSSLKLHTEVVELKKLLKEKEEAICLANVELESYKKQYRALDVENASNKLKVEDLTIKLASYEKQQKILEKQNFEFSTSNSRLELEKQKMTQHVLDLKKVIELEKNDNKVIQDCLELRKLKIETKEKDQMQLTIKMRETESKLRQEAHTLREETLKLKRQKRGIKAMVESLTNVLNTTAQTKSIMWEPTREPSFY